MLISVFASLMAVLIGFFAPESFQIDLRLFPMIMLIGGILILLCTLFLNSIVFIPLANLEQKLIPNLMDSVRHNFLSHMGILLLFLFAFVSIIFFPFADIIKNPNYEHWLFLGWIVFFGVALDLLRNTWNHYANLLNPSYLVNLISDKALTAVKNDKNDQLRTHLDSLTEVALRSVEKSKLALSTQALQAFPPIYHAFFSSAQSISHTSQDILKEKGKGGDETSYMTFYLLHRLEVIYDKALTNGLETICRQMIMILGKIIIYSAKYDLSMVSFPTHFLTKFGLKAQQHHYDEVGVLTISTLLEISRAILTEIDVTYAELEKPFRSIINGLDALAKGTFKKRKDTSFKVLVQPFLDLKALFNTEKMSHHRDTPIILQEIDRILEEYQVLEQVLSTMPTFSNPEENENRS